MSAPTFPVRPFNRPALDRIGYRVGAYPDVLDAMLRELNAAPELAAWTHRGADDPGIALLESAAVVADILTFYQEHYANEAFLRTAQWRESIQELVRLTGYRLAPAVGGRATFGFEVKGTAPITVPAEFPLKHDLAAGGDPVDFLTTIELTAHPHLGRFRLYRRRYVDPSVNSGRRELEVASVGGAGDPDSLAAFDLKKGDRLMLVAAPPAWLTSGTTVTTQPLPQVVKVSKVTHRLGRLLVEIEGKTEHSWSAPVKAYRVGRSFRHFGHNTPPKTTYQTGSGSTLTTHQTAAHLQRHIRGECQGSPSELHTPIPKNIIPLDQEVNDLSLRGTILVEATIKPSSSATTVRRVTFARIIRGLRAVTMNWGNVSGPSTWIDLGAGEELMSNPSLTGSTADLREFRIHEVTSPDLVLNDRTVFLAGLIIGNQELWFYGTETEAAVLPGRRIFLQHPDGRTAFCSVVDVDLAAPAHARMRRLTLDKRPKGFRRQDFDEAAPTTDVFGNLVDVTQGKPEKEVALGNGDARESYQSFKLPKAPLTYLLDPAATPPQVPELTLRVNGREWTRVDAFFGRSPKDEVYIVREGPDGTSYVQFGDGLTGARLPSGLNNVTAEFRTGSGALGPGKPGAKPSAGQRLDGLDKLALAGEVTGGAPAEDGAKSRIAAPGRLQSLGRLVSLADYETETLQIPGVVTAAASWAILEATPTVRLTVLLEQAQQSDTQFAAMEAVIRAADRARGPQRHPIRVTQGELRYVYLTLTFAPRPDLRTTDVESAVRDALGLAGDPAHERSGLFGLRRRRLGEKEYATRVEAAVQNVPGIVWCRVDFLGLLPPANDPSTLVVPGTPVRHARLACASHELLQLDPRHLSLLPSTP